MSGFLRKLSMGVAVTVACLGALAVLTSYEIKEIERSSPPGGKFIRVDGGRLHVMELGSVGAPAVVLLHGANANLEDMRLALGKQLAGNFHVILIDRPGHGWSDRPNGEADASPIRQARLIHQALGRIGINRPILVGHSWSGALAAAYALNFPNDVEGLVLLAPVTHPWPKNNAWYNSVVVALLEESARCAANPIIGPIFARTVAVPLGRFLIPFGVRSAFSPQLAPKDYIAKAKVELELRPSNLISSAQDLAAIREYVESEFPRYSDIKVPTVVLTGDLDNVVPFEANAIKMASSVPNAKLIVMPGAGHMVHFAVSERIVEVVTELSRVSPETRHSTKWR